MSTHAGIVLAISPPLFTGCTAMVVVPTKWKEACVMPLYKSGKNKNNPTTYRPFSVSAHADKLMKLKVKARIEHVVASNNLLNTNQSGLKKSRSTIDQLVLLKQDVTFTINTGR